MFGVVGKVDGKLECQLLDYLLGQCDTPASPRKDGQVSCAPLQTRLRQASFTVRSDSFH